MTHDVIIAATSIHVIRYFPLLVSAAFATVACSTENETSIDTVLVVLHLQEILIGITLAPFGVSVTGSEDRRGTQTVATHFSDCKQ